MRINRDKLNKLAHTVADTLAEIDEVGSGGSQHHPPGGAQGFSLLTEEARIDTAARLKIANQRKIILGRLAGVGDSVPQVLQRRSQKAGHLGRRFSAFGFGIDPIFVKVSEWPGNGCPHKCGAIV
jgi:hypothetical protein